MTQKALVIESINELPEDSTLEEISERVEFLAAIQKGFDQIERRETISHDQLKRELASWLR